MITNLELYGTKDVPKVPKEIADKRIDLLTARLKELMDVHWTQQDTHLINKVRSALDFWRQLKQGETV